MSTELELYRITRTKDVVPGTEKVTLGLSPRLSFKVGESHDAKTDRLTVAQLARDGYEVQPVTKGTPTDEWKVAEIDSYIRDSELEVSMSLNKADKLTAIAEIEAEAGSEERAEEVTDEQADKE